MTHAQYYCTIADLVADLNLSGDEPRLAERIREASQFVARQLGRFLPVYETRTLPGVSVETLRLGRPLLTIGTVTLDGVAVTDYTAEPADRAWDNGPYTELVRTDGWGSADSSVVIAGWWGLYEEYEALGATASQLVGDMTLVLSDGSIVSPGMVLRLGDELELVTAGNGGKGSPSATAAVSTLTATVDNATEALAVTSGAEFHEGKVLAIGTEDCYVRKIAGNALVVGRGWNKTTRAAHTSGDAIGVYRTAKVTRGVNGSTAAAHVSASLLRVLPPADVAWLALQVAGLMRAKASSGFSGKAGDPALGDTFFVNEFPRQLAQIQENYSIPYL